MSLEAGTRIGPYEVLSKLGEGGMGEVYRARDTKLQRDVAIKTISAYLAGNPERIARFEREAQLLAALNHPNIGAIYGLEDSPSGRFLILELVEGESLAQRLASVGSGGLDIPTAMSIASQIVDALDAAHDRGIVHRDLKPANIMLTNDGQVKVLDFGLARTMEADPAASAMNSPTLTFAATQAGVILGTAAYMSPEQAKGRIADKRSDVWAFGCVLYEMLTGKRAFEGEDVSDTLAAILRGEPDWTALPRELPPHIASLLRRCLQKDRKGRIPDICVVRYLMAEKSAASERSDESRTVLIRRQLAVGGAGLALGLAVCAALWWLAAAPTPSARQQPARFEIVPQPTDALFFNPADRAIALSPDGTHITYSRRGPDGSFQLVIRPIDRLATVPMPGTEGARQPFFSPDGRWVGFFTSGELKKISVTGGPAEILCKIPNAPRGGTWTSLDTIIFASAGTDSGLMSVSASGGDPKELTKPAGGSGADHLYPSALPDGRSVLFAIVPRPNVDSGQIALLDLETGDQQILVRGGTQPEYMAGHLIYGAGGSLRALRFDVASRKTSGDAVPVEQGVWSGTAGSVSYAVSRQGHLVFVSGTALSGGVRGVVWVDRRGREETIPSPEHAYVMARLSPTGDRLALSSRGEDEDIWVWDLARRTRIRLTTDPGADLNPTWTPDGRRIVFSSVRSGSDNLYVTQADRTGIVHRLTTADSVQFPQSITRDGQLIYLEFRGGPPDIFVRPLDGTSSSRPLIQTPFAEGNAQVSSDGRWLAYSSDEAGRNVYVRPFPNVDAQLYVVSPGGGSRPVWSPRGGELFYLNEDGAMMAVRVETTPTFRAADPVKLFDTRYFMGGNARAFDVSPDGQRFVMIKNVFATDGTVEPPNIVAVLNWAEEVRTKVR